MATVPYGNQQVSDQPLPSARVNTDQSIETFGGGTTVTKPLAGAEHLSNTAMDIQEKAYKAANDAANVSHQNKVQLATSSLLHGTNGPDGQFIPGLIQRLSGAGKDAHAMGDAAFDGLDKTMSDLINQAPNDVQKQALINYYQDERKKAFDTVQIHIASEQKSYEKEQNTTHLNNSINEAVNGYYRPDIRNAAMKEIEKTQLAYGPLHNESPDESKAAIDIHQAKLKYGVIQKYLNNDDVNGARKYYTNEVKGTVIDKTISWEIDKLMHEGTQEGDVRRFSADIASKHNDVAAGIRSVDEDKRIPEDLKKKVQSEVEHRIRVENEKTAVARADNIQKSVDFVTKHGYDNLGWERKGQLSEGEKADLRVISNDADGSIPIKTDQKVLAETRMMKPDQLQKLKPDQLIKYRVGLGGEDYNAFMDRVKTAKEASGGGPTGNKQAMAKATEQHLSPYVVDALKAAKIIGYKDEPKDISGNANKREAFHAIYDAAEKKINEIQSQKTGVIVSDVEKKKIIADLATQKVFTTEPGMLWGTNDSKTKTLAQLNPEEQKTFKVHFDDIPTPQKKAIFDIGKSGAFPANMTQEEAMKKYPGKFEQAAAAALRGADPKQIRAILGGQ